MPGLWAIDFAHKHRGVSLRGEFYMRDLSHLIGNGPISRSSIFDSGGFAQAGYFVLPQRQKIKVSAHRGSVLSVARGQLLEESGQSVAD